MPVDYQDVTVVPRIAVQLPLPLPIPEGFDPARPETWPVVTGRLEYVHGSLLFMPPCGDLQQQTATDLLTELNLWRRSRPEYVVGGNEAGMLLGGEVRAAEAAVWRKDDLGPPTGGFPRVAPLLAVEIAGKDEELESLGEKARWYLARGVSAVWLLDPRTRVAEVWTTDGVVELRPGQRMPVLTLLPGLEPKVDDLFRQVS